MHIKPLLLYSTVLELAASMALNIQVSAETAKQTLMIAGTSPTRIVDELLGKIVETLQHPNDNLSFVPAIRQDTLSMESVDWGIVITPGGIITRGHDDKWVRVHVPIEGTIVNAVYPKTLLKIIQVNAEVLLAHFGPEHGYIHLEVREDTNREALISFSADDDNNAEMIRLMLRDELKERHNLDSLVTNSIILPTALPHSDGTKIRVKGTGFSVYHRETLTEYSALFHQQAVPQKPNPEVNAETTSWVNPPVVEEAVNAFREQVAKIFKDFQIVKNVEAAETHEVDVVAFNSGKDVLSVLEFLRNRGISHYYLVSVLAEQKSDPANICPQGGGFKVPIWVFHLKRKHRPDLVVQDRALDYQIRALVVDSALPAEKVSYRE